MGFTGKLEVSFIQEIIPKSFRHSPVRYCLLSIPPPQLSTVVKERVGFPLLLRTNNMHVTFSSCTNHISRYICRQRSRFPRNGSLLFIGQFKKRNAELEWAAVSWGGALRDDPNNGCEGDLRVGDPVAKWLVSGSTRKALDFVARSCRFNPALSTVVRLRKKGGKVLLLLCIGPTNF